MHTMNCIELNAQQSDVISDLLYVNHAVILQNWKNQQRVQNVLSARDLDIEFFMKHFGSRVLDYFISVLRGEQKPGQCPVIIVMLKFFSNNRLSLEDIYQICSGKRNTVVNLLIENGVHHSEEIFKATVDMFDANFSGVIKEYIDLTMERHSVGLEKKVVTDSANNEAHSIQIDFKEQLQESLLNDYFAEDEDDGDEKVLFREDDIDDMIEHFAEISEHLYLATVNSDLNEVQSVSALFSRISSILLHYTPYIDTLAASMGDLSIALSEHDDSFLEVLQNSKDDDMLKLFDAVSRDMDKYMERFSMESLAMKNSHHIHEPTTLSVRQIISTFAPDEVEDGEMEFFI